MKRNILILICFLCAISAKSQELIDIYKKGTIKLVADNEFATNNDWNKIFRLSENSSEKENTRGIKSLLIMPNGSVIVNNENKKYYSLFSPQGKFIKEFTITDSKGKPFKQIKPIEGIINNNTFYTGIYNPGYINCFDFNGKWVKTLKLDYQSLQMVSLPNQKIAIVGHSFGRGYSKVFVSIVDYNTNKEKIIWDQNSNRDNSNNNKPDFVYSYSFKSAGQSIYIGIWPFAKYGGLVDPPIISTVNNKIIVSIPTTGEILIYDLEGNLKSKQKTSWPEKYISVEEQQEILKKDIIDMKNSTSFKGIKNISDEEFNIAKETILKNMESDYNKIKTRFLIPTFSTIIGDSDGNLLFFEYPEEKGSNKNIFNVWVYEKTGNFVCQSRFVCDDYDLKINPSRMVFHKGYLYSLQESKKATGMKLRLVRFKLTAN